MTSIQSKIYSVLLRVAEYKNSITKEFTTNDFSKKADAAEPLPGIASNYDVTCDKARNGRKIWTLKQRDTRSERYILYLHGGAYVHNLVKQHWSFIYKLLSNTQYHFVVPDYPLAPAHTYKDSFEMVVPVYKELLQTAGSENVVIMGDSAGGGFALALAQYARNEQLSQPHHIVLLSPWLDVSLQNPEIRDVDPFDPLLGVEGAQLAGKAYAGESDLDNYMISPINGPVEGLAPISIYIGSYDILVPDARKFKQLANAAGIPINYIEYPKMIHVFMLLKMPEATKAIKQIIQLLNDYENKT